ncbi:flavin-binding protein dodecin [Nocardia kruczakiae]|uniref:Flavin-binding protein dodecin n=1 Tax=Nocardia kruczakiae TaxID=261477 RepID=A0ABU1XPS6_9NOCA|nr:dodecin domain-containing protein [Nocardia kruczakiae]MDR7172566.1 flavin-binding protein dodecin [Nocardia kruczakiae]
MVGLSRAARTTRNLDWFEVESVRGYRDADTVAYYQVTMNLFVGVVDSEADL